MKQQQGETCHELVTRLHDLGKKWLKDCDTVEATIDIIMLEHLLGTLPEKMKIWVSEQKPTSSAQAGQLAEEYLQPRKLTQECQKVSPCRVKPALFVLYQS